MNSDDILSAVNSVTKKWTKHRQKEERQHRGRRQHFYSDRVNFTDVAGEILPDAYAHASGGGKYSLPQRNFFYAAREAFRKATDREITFNRFKTIMRQYMNRNDVDWKITADPRGNFQIPNTVGECIIPCGTIQIDKYLADSKYCTDENLDATLSKLWPSKAAGQRYQAILYIEKEGFDPMLKEARIASKYDLAVLSCKGQSVAAARKLVDHVCKESGGLPLFVVHDFDKAGFEICKCLTSVSWDQIDQNTAPYMFENNIGVTDLGLRLRDAEKYELASEVVDFRGKLPPGITAKEGKFLQGNQRIELNAFTCEQFIEWLESKLNKHLKKRMIPVDDVIEQAYRRAFAVLKINNAIEEVQEEIEVQAGELTLPKRIKAKIRAEMERTGKPWDVALYAIAEKETQ